MQPGHGLLTCCHLVLVYMSNATEKSPICFKPWQWIGYQYLKGNSASFTHALVMVAFIMVLAVNRNHAVNFWANASGCIMGNVESRPFRACCLAHTRNLKIKIYNDLWCISWWAMICNSTLNRYGWEKTKKHQMQNFQRESLMMQKDAWVGGRNVNSQINMENVFCATFCVSRRNIIWCESVFGVKLKCECLCTTCWVGFHTIGSSAGFLFRRYLKATGRNDKVRADM